MQGTRDLTRGSACKERPVSLKQRGREKQSTDKDHTDERWTRSRTSGSYPQNRAVFTDGPRGQEVRKLGRRQRMLRVEGGDARNKEEDEEVQHLFIVYP